MTGPWYLHIPKHKICHTLFSSLSFQYSSILLLSIQTSSFRVSAWTHLDCLLVLGTVILIPHQHLYLPGSPEDKMNPAEWDYPAEWVHHHIRLNNKANTVLSTDQGVSTVLYDLLYCPPDPDLRLWSFIQYVAHSAGLTDLSEWP